MAFVPEVSKSSCADRPRQQPRDSDSTSFLSELLNIYSPPQQDLSQPQYRENHSNSEESEATCATTLKMDYPKANQLPSYDNRVEHSQPDAALRAESNGLRRADVNELSEGEAHKDSVDSTRQQANAGGVKSESSDPAASKDDSVGDSSPQRSDSLPKTDKDTSSQASQQFSEKSAAENSESINPVAPKQVSISDTLLLKFNSLLKLYEDPNLQADLPLGEKSANDEMRFKMLGAELLKQNHAFGDSDAKGTRPALTNLENLEVLSTDSSLERRQTDRFNKGAEDDGQSMLLKSSTENVERPESSSARSFSLNAQDSRSSENTEGKGVPRFINEAPSNLGNSELFSTEGTSKNQKGSDSQIVGFDKTIDLLASGLLKNEQLVAQTNLAKGSQDILKAIELIENIKEKIVFMARNNQEQAVLKLHSSELGRLEVRLELLDKTCRAQIFVQSETVKSLIESQSSELARGLRDAGLELSDLFVSLGWDGDKKGFLHEGVQFSNENPDEAYTAKKQSIPIQRVNRLSDGVVDIIA